MTQGHSREDVPSTLDDSLAPSDVASIQGRVQHTPPRPSGQPRPKSKAPSQEARAARRASAASRADYDVPDTYANLGETADASAIRNPDEASVCHLRSLEQLRDQEQEYVGGQRLQRQDSAGRRAQEEEKEAEAATYPVSRLATQIYTLSYLVFFSIWGTLARLGLQALTTYPGAPVIYSSIWPNFAGSLIMGFLAEDRMLLREEWGKSNGSRERDEEASDAHVAAARKAHLSIKKTIPLYIGLATGFCGSFTSFASFVRDMYLALANDLPAIDGPPRNGGYSFLALVGVVMMTVSLSLSGLFLGAHLAIFLEPITPSIPFLFTRKILDRLVVLLGWGCWLGAVLLSIFPPHDYWRGTATFALVFAPLGCLLRFYMSMYLNGRMASFPLGTFAVNIFGTAILGMSWDLAHVPLGGVVGCQVLQGVQDGFCGCLTTVSTWVSELATLRRRHAYVYGSASVLAGLAIMVAVMGGLRWSGGWEALVCTH
ncbi:CrcB-like protein-domain-containing protein [Podospora australis]|uniref:CrcB-like protein-domain-containing protein n=1 Tax=Podospora australis TaxID=1536484 RepID=A0AAN6WRN8_9PEZI|nr:CrcB-like protein-domain-containing protein [Podospora australis]